MFVKFNNPKDFCVNLIKYHQEKSVFLCDTQSGIFFFSFSSLLSVFPEKYTLKKKRGKELSLHTQKLLYPFYSEHVFVYVIMYECE